MLAAAGAGAGAGDEKKGGEEVRWEVRGCHSTGQAPRLVVAGLTVKCVRGGCLVAQVDDTYARFFTDGKGVEVPVKGPWTWDAMMYKIQAEGAGEGPGAPPPPAPPAAGQAHGDDDNEEDDQEEESKRRGRALHAWETGPSIGHHLTQLDSGKGCELVGSMALLFHSKTMA